MTEEACGAKGETREEHGGSRSVAFGAWPRSSRQHAQLTGPPLRSRSAGGGVADGCAQLQGEPDGTGETQRDADGAGEVQAGPVPRLYDAGLARANQGDPVRASFAPVRTAAEPVRTGSDPRLSRLIRAEPGASAAGR